MTVIIIEDEKPAARLLQRKLQRLGIDVGTMLHSVEEAVGWFKGNAHPDLIFLDIQLSDGLSFDIFEAVKISSAVIFTTAYDEYALRAFKLNSIDYLLKPIDEDDLETAIQKFRERNQSLQQPVLHLDLVKQMLSGNTKEYKKRFTIKTGQHLKVIAAEETECFYSENKGTYLHTNDNRDYSIDTTLEQLETELDPAMFYRVSRKFIINMKAIKDIVVYSNSRLKIQLATYTGDEIIVSRERVNDFRQWLG